MYVIVQHEVRDYDSWKPAFDEHEDVRKKYGCRSHTIFRDATNPNEVRILMEWESRDGVEGFLRDPSLAEAMQRGGVVSEPLATFLEESDSKTYAQRAAA